MKIPNYAKAVLLILGLFALLAMLYIAQSIIIPLIFALILAIVLQPVVDFFVKHKINRLIAILFTLFITFLILAAFGLLLYLQANRFSNSWPLLVDNFADLINETILWVSGFLDINSREIYEWIDKTKEELFNNSSGAIGNTLANVGSMLIVAFLLPVYIFLILYYQPLLIDFIHRLFGKNNHDEVTGIVLQIKTVIQRYLFGLLIETVIVATLYIAALWFLGIKYAVLLGIIAALLNLIPYIGGIVGVALPMMVALATKSTAWYAFYIMVIYYVIQLIDNNIIVPKIVASKVKINALFSIIVVIAGNALWGIPGMFLSIPLLAIIKLMCDHIESLKPWGFLLGDSMPSIMRKSKILEKIKSG